MNPRPDPFATPQAGGTPHGSNGGASRRIAVLGAGPVGLDAALAARAAGFPVRVFEAAPHPSAHVRRWGHVELFSPWRMNLSDRMRAGMAEIGLGFDEDPDGSHTGHDLADRVLDPLWHSPLLADSLRTGTTVIAIGRQGTLKHEEIGSTVRGDRPFRILLRDDGGRERTEFADVILDCTGKFGNPNTLGDGGIPAPGEGGCEAWIHRWLPDLEADEDNWSGATILLAGGGHSAQTAVRELDRMARRSRGTRVIWALRSTDPDLGIIPDDPLPNRGALVEAASELARSASTAVEPHLGVVVDSMEPVGDRVRVRLRADGRVGSDGDSGREAVARVVEVDRILALTGGVGDHSIYRQLQVHECYATSGPMKLAAALLGSAGGDCLAQESHGADALANPEPGFFILGDKSYGRNNTFLLRVGWSQVDEVFGVLGAAGPS